MKNDVIDMLEKIDFSKSVCSVISADNIGDILYEDVKFTFGDNLELVFNVKRYGLLSVFVKLIKVGSEECEYYVPYMLFDTARSVANVPKNEPTILEILKKLL